MRCIVYVSAAAPGMTSEGLDLIVGEAARLNRENGITGVLLHNEGDFMQCIEGSAKAVAETFAMINASRQHRGLIVLMDEKLTKREFAAWHMGSAGIPRSEMLALKTARWELAQAEIGQAGELPVGFTLLSQFWRNAHRARGGK